jgi:cytochrome c peroxidase
MRSQFSPTSLVFALLALSALASCNKPSESGPAAATSTSTGAVNASAAPAASAAKAAVFDPAMAAVFAALPAAPASGLDAKASLGRMLYFEARLSKNHDHSCNSCHKLDAFGVDGEATSEGHKKQRGGRNSPTVLNASLHFRQFWDGRAADVEEQATGPIANPVEMASDEKRVVETLTSMPEYVAAFKKAFPEAREVKDAITLKNVGVAIGAYERLLVTPGRWDKYLGGDKTALTPAELEGVATFSQTGCVVCHAGPAVGGAMYQKVGLVKPWPNLKDDGRFAVTKQDADKAMFKVPSLRNVAKTAPYFHDGATPTLAEAIKLMARHQLGKELSDDEIKRIVTFLEVLTAPPAAELVAPPALPKSTDKTPKPDPA